MGLRKRGADPALQLFSRAPREGPNSREQAKKQANQLIFGRFRENCREKRKDSRRFQENSLAGRTGSVFGRSGNSSSLLGEKQILCGWTAAGLGRLSFHASMEATDE